MKKKKRKRIKLRNLSRDEIANFQFELRKAMLHIGAQQQTGMIFELKTPEGMHRYELTKRALLHYTLRLNWNRKGKHGHPAPYWWEFDEVGWYQDLSIVLNKYKVPIKITGLISI